MLVRQEQPKCVVSAASAICTKALHVGTLAQDVAERIGRMARKRAFNVTLSSMDAFPLIALPSSRTVVLVAATTGDGDPPDNMKVRWRFSGREWEQSQNEYLLPLRSTGLLEISVAN